ncbi:hypothetical protein ACO03V_15495 [Microbacterium sp. HMH0099]|uniref:hypothetical protein n=1 Tax=Microbacterium sp. HMH0099 TaxID=3414026 RepID=UPI003BF649A5
MGDAPLDDCGWLDVGCGIGNVVKGGIEEFVRSLADGAVQFLGWLTSFWINIPSPDVQSDAIGQITSGLHFYTIVLAIVGLLVTLIRMIFSNSFRDGMPAVKMIVNLIVVTGVYTAATTALILAGDSFAPWIIERATGTQDLDLTQLLTTQAIMTAGVGPGVLLGIVALLGSLMNVILMILRGVLVTLVFAFLPALAAASATEAGNQAFKKAQGYLLALILFKPVAAVIYALGLLLIRTPPSFTTTDELGASLYHVSVGVMTLLIAGLALPAIIKFIAPVAAGGVSSAFSGAGLAAGGVAAGAAVVSLGAGAAAGGALAAKGAATTASTAGNAAAATGQGARAVASTAANNSGGGGGGAAVATAPRTGGGDSAAPSSSGGSSPSTQNGRGASATPSSSGGAGGGAQTSAAPTRGAAAGGAQSAAPTTRRRDNTGRVADLTAGGARTINRTVDDTAEEK